MPRIPQTAGETLTQIHSHTVDFSQAVGVRQISAPIESKGCDVTDGQTDGRGRTEACE